MMSEEVIRKELQKIKNLKKEIETRLWDTANNVTGSDGEELSKANIELRINKLADQLIEKYPDECPVLVGLMDGALPFASKLHDALAARNYSFQFTCMQVSSYGSEMHSGELTMGSLPKIELGDRLVIIVDDVCDTGKTFFKTRELFQSLGAKEVELMTLVDKVQERAEGCHPKFSGFKVSKEAFIIGFGLDFDGLLRNTSSIKSVNTQYLPTKEEKLLLNREKQLNKELRDLQAYKPHTSSPGNSRDSLFATSKEDSAKVPTKVFTPDVTTIQYS